MKQSARRKRIVLDRETIDLRGLRVFARVARLRGVTAGGGELGLPKSAVSKLLGRLEEQIGVRVDRQFLAQQVRPQRPNAFQVFDRSVEDIGQGALPRRSE